MYVAMSIFLCMLFFIGCVQEMEPSDEGADQFQEPYGIGSDFEPTVLDYRVLSGWHPRTHPPGTLLLDTHGDYWMAVNWLERVPVSSDAFAEVGLSDHDAVRMTSVEENCLRGVEPYWWGSPLGDWLSVIGPDHETWLVNVYLGLKRRASVEVLYSWGFSVRHGEFDGRIEEWDMLREVESLRFRDGFLLRTERGISYFVNGERWLFASDILAREAGYALDEVCFMPEEGLAIPVYGTFTREVFGICPVETPLADMIDNDVDGIPRHRDCDDEDSTIGEDSPELCDGKDNDCNGITDDLFHVGMNCRFTLGDCRLDGHEVCLPDGSATFCDADDNLCDC